MPRAPLRSPVMRAGNPSGRLASGRVVLRPVDWATATVAQAGGGRPADWADDFPTPGSVTAAELAAVPAAAESMAIETGVFGLHWIVERATGRVVGEIGCLDGPDATGAVEIGFALAPSGRRRGLAGEAVRQVVDQLGDDGRAERLVATTTIRNRDAQAVLTRAGFQLTGFVADLLLYELSLVGAGHQPSASASSGRSLTANPQGARSGCQATPVRLGP